MLKQALMVSPFRYNPYTIVENSSNNSEVSYGDILLMYKEQKLSILHSDILKLLLQYKYLTRHQIETALGNSKFNMPNGYAISVDKAISFMADNGLLLRKYMKYDDNTTVVHDTDESSNDESSEFTLSKRSVNYYCLSESAFTFAYKEFKGVLVGIDLDGKYSYSNDVLSILKALSINNFLITYTTLSNELLKFQYNVICSDNEHTMTLDAYCNGLSTNNDNPSTGYGIYSIRREPNWESRLNDDISTFCAVMMKKIEAGERKYIPSLIFICENDIHAIDSNKAISEVIDKFKLTTYYTTDIRIHNKFTQECMLRISWDIVNNGALLYDVKTPIININ